MFRVSLNVDLWPRTVYSPATVSVLRASYYLSGDYYAGQDETMDYQHHLPLAPRDLLILSVLAEGPLHGYGIIKAVEARFQPEVLLDPANLYRVLRRMRRVRWIRENGSASAREVALNGPGRRKTYEITADGRALLTAELSRLEKLLRCARPAMAKGGGR